MSMKSQENNMRCLAALLSRELGYCWGERESGPNGDKKRFLNVGKVFLRALAKDLGLRDSKVSTSAGGIAVSGECSLIGMWAEEGIYICIYQSAYQRDRVLCYRTVRHTKDFKGGYNRFVTRDELEKQFNIELPELSMGMTGDFPEALAEGSTIIRIGTRLFGRR